MLACLLSTYPRSPPGSNQQQWVRVDLKPAHAVVDHRRHDRNVEFVVHGQGQVVEELLAPRVVGHAAAVGLVRALVLVLALLLRTPVNNFE